MSFDEEIRTKVKCCVSGEPLLDSPYINMVETDYVATWHGTTMGNIITGDAGYAVGFVHDKYLKPGLTLRHVVELRYEEKQNQWDDSVIREVIYHPVESLEKRPRKPWPTALN